MSDHDELNKMLVASENAEQTFKRAMKKLSKKQRHVLPEYHPPLELGTDGRSEEALHNSYVHWTTADGNIFIPAAKTVKELTPGAYEIDQCQSSGIYFERIPVKTDDLIRFPDSNSDKVITEISKFWEREDVFKEYGLTHKRGIILYGPAGGGKTSIVRLVMEDVITRGGIVIKFGNPYLFIDGMRILRQIQKVTPVVVIMEDIDAILDSYNESEILNILDGINEVNRTVFLATTNYPEQLGARIVNRPSRFDKRFRIGYPSAIARRIYFEHLIGKGDEKLLKSKIKDLKLDLDMWVKDTDGMSIAHLQELFISVVIIGDSYEEAVSTLRSMKEVLKDKDYDSDMGFHLSKAKNFYD